MWFRFHRERDWKRDRIRETARERVRERDKIWLLDRINSFYLTKRTKKLVCSSIIGETWHMEMSMRQARWEIFNLRRRTHAFIYLSVRKATGVSDHWIDKTSSFEKNYSCTRDPVLCDEKNCATRRINFLLFLWGELFYHIHIWENSWEEPKRYDTDLQLSKLISLTTSRWGFYF